MSISLEALDRSIRSDRTIAVAYRSPRNSDSGGVGITVSLFYHLNVYVVSVEKFRDDGGFGENLSRTERDLGTLKDALDEVARNGFNVDELELQKDGVPVTPNSAELRNGQNGEQPCGEQASGGQSKG